MEIKPLVIVGASGFGREVYRYIQDINRVKPEWDVLGFLDENLTGQTVEGVMILGPDSLLKDMDPKPWVTVAIADPTIRRRVVSKLEQYGVEFATIIHPTVSITEHSKIGRGVIMCLGNLLTTNINIGDFCIFNVYITVGHDTEIHDYVSIMSNTDIGGDVVIGEGCYFGLGCTVINAVNIGAWSTIGAGSVVVSDIPSEVTAVGVPARVIKSKTV